MTPFCWAKTAKCAKCVFPDRSAFSFSANNPFNQGAPLIPDHLEREVAANGRFPLIIFNCCFRATCYLQESPDSRANVDSSFRTRRLFQAGEESAFVCCTASN